MHAFVDSISFIPVELCQFCRNIPPKISYQWEKCHWIGVNGMIHATSSFEMLQSWGISTTFEHFISIITRRIFLMHMLVWWFANYSKHSSWKFQQFRSALFAHTLVSYRVVYSPETVFSAAMITMLIKQAILNISLCAQVYGLSAHCYFATHIHFDTLVYNL